MVLASIRYSSADAAQPGNCEKRLHRLEGLLTYAFRGPFVHHLASFCVRQRDPVFVLAATECARK